MIPYRLAAMLLDDEVGLVFEGVQPSPVTLVGTWANVIELRSPNQRIELRIDNKRIE